MDYRIKAHETFYNGITFRSRLEARWAALFDIFGWDWEYEPVDIHGWTPDFTIRGKQNNLLVEVKPYDWITGQDNAKLVQDSKAIKKVFAGNKDEVLVLGAYPLGEDDWCTNLGFLLNIDTSDGSTDEAIYADPAALDYGRSHKYDVRAMYGSFAFRLGGEYDGDSYCNPVKPAELTQMWRKASNAVKTKY